MAYRNVVVGSDGSETAERAVRQAGELAASSGARLVVVTAYLPSDGRDATREDALPADLRWVLTDRAQAEELARHGRTLAREAGAERVSVQAIEGDPSDAILEVAKDFDADAIVVGSVGLTGAARFLGSVASSVAHHAPCDVLIVHTA